MYVESVLSLQYAQQQFGGNANGDGSHKATPIVGSSKTNALGLLDIHLHFQTESSPERLGRTTPVLLLQTIRPVNRSRVPSLFPISTMDKKLGSIIF
ncbi:hypothetical protein F5877DRAFT_86806 [Lentinula edodes]|nr:hypothetical protein F5877DRAFT_86806 [Lentinula edodes]